jgi:hypothetical protein
LGLQIVSVNADRPDNIEDALQPPARERVEVVIVPQTSLFVVKDAQIAHQHLRSGANGLRISRERHTANAPADDAVRPLSAALLCRTRMVRGKEGMDRLALGTQTPTGVI